jgi:hypothetical protein
MHTNDFDINNVYITFKALAIEPFYMREPNPSEPANYKGSYTIASKEIADTEIRSNGL